MRKIIIPATALAVLALSCGEEEPPPPPVNTPVEVLKNIEISFNQRDIDLLKNCLSPNFVYYTDPGEIGRPRPEGTPYRPPPCYTFTEFWNIAYNMFKGAYSISFSISTAGVGEPAPEENTYYADNVELSLLAMVDELNGYIADEGYCHFEFEKYRNEEGQVRWRITNWWDDTKGGGEAPAGIERVPLWYILSLYEKPV